MKTSKTTQATFSRCRLAPLLSLALPLAGSPLFAQEEAAAPPPSKVHVLFNMEFSDKYLTPRGMVVQDNGLVYQPLLLAFASLYANDSFSLTGVGGVWNCFGTSGLPSSDSNGAQRTSWYEIDPIAGISIGFAKNFTLDVTYTAFNMEIFNIPFSQHLETKFAFNDSDYLGAFALHPYLLFWQELSGKATAAQVPFGALPGPVPGPGNLPDSSYYLEFGIAPSYTFKDLGLKIEIPFRILLPNEDFYGEYYAEASTVGLYEIGIKATMPLKFMPKGYGSWSAHVGFKYMGFEDENLQGMQQFNAPGKAVDSATAVNFGISTFF